MKNDELYNLCREVPDSAKKPITAGRLKGKTDINHMWRIKRLTEMFGACGFGWWYTVDKQWLETGANGEISAFCNISLYCKVDGEISQAIPGTGGSSFVTSERNGLYTSDEAYKMALTDALSVACKALGMGADVYWEADRTKYDTRPGSTPVNPDAPESPIPPPRYDNPEAQTEADKAKIRNLITDERYQEKARAVMAAMGYSATKHIPHSKIDTYINQVMAS